MLCHEFAQEGDAVHARHLDIEDDDVGHLLLNAARRHERVGRGADHLYAGIRRKDPGQDLTHRGGVIDDQNANRASHGAYTFRNTVGPTGSTGN